MADEQSLNWELAKSKLNPEDAFFLENSEAGSVPLNETKEVRIAWEFAVDDNYSLFENFLRLRTWATNDVEQRYVVDPVVDSVTLHGTWRQAFITRLEREERGTRKLLVVLTLRKGWAKAIDWTEALLVTRKDSEGNDESVSGVDDTSSYNDASAIVVRFPNISPYKINACIASLPDATITSPTVQKEQLTGVWHKAFVTGGKEQDGSGYVDLVLSRDRFTVSLYQYYGTIRQSSIYKLYNVTKDIAQTIVDDWQAEGRSADISYNENDARCVVTLTDRDAAKDNMSTGWIKNACDQWTQVHFAWGYTKDELEDWIKVHNGVVDAVAGDEGADTQPIRRQVSVRERGDGLFNAEITESKFDNADPTSADFTITVPSGTKITRQIDHGWNFKSSEVSANDIKQTYDTTVAAIGKTIEFRVTREDDCSFDWQAIITVSAAAEETIESAKDGTQGLNRKLFVGRDAQAAEVSALEALIAGGARKRAEVRADVGENETVSYSAVLTELQKAQDTMSSGAAGEAVTAFTGRNVDPADLDAVAALASGIRKQVIIDLSSNDDGTFNYSARLTEPDEVQETASSYTGAFAAADGIGVKTHAGKNVDPGDLQTLITDLSAARVRLSISLQANDDGSLNYSVTEQHVQEAENTINSGAGGVGITVYAGKNMDIGDITGLTSAIRQRVSLQLSANDDGTYDWTGTKQTVQETNSSHTTTGTDGVVQKLYFGENADLGDLPAITSDFRKRHTISVSPQDDGSVRYSIVEQTVDTVGDSWAVEGGSFGLDKVMYVGTNATIAEIDAVVGGLAATSELVDYDMSVSGNDDGTVNYVIRKVTKVASETAYNVGSIGNNVDLSVGRNLNTLADPGHPVAKGVTVALDVNFSDDGGIQYVQRTNTKVEQDSGAVKGGTYTKAVQKDYRVGDSALDDLDASGTVAEGVSVDWQLQLAQDGSAAWAKVTSTAQAKATSTTAHLSNLLPTLDKFGYTDDIKLFSGVPNASLGTYFNFTGSVYGYVDSARFHEDGTVSGRRIERTYKATASTNHTDVSITWPSSTSATIKDHITKYATLADGKIYLLKTDVSWTYSWLVTSDWLAVDSFVNNGYTGTRVTQISIYGKQFWFAMKIAAPTYASWSKAIATALEDVV